MFRFVCFATTIAFLCGERAHADASRIDANSILALLDAVDTILAEHPEAGPIAAQLESLDAEERRVRLDELARANAENPRVAAAIDTFLETEARQIYFRRVSNVTPNHFRRALNALPYEKISAPGDIAEPLYGLVERRDEVREMVERVVAETDLQACLANAKRWLPPGDQALPPVYFVYDNNVGSFTAEGRVFYNVYSGENAAQLGESGSAVLAHEIHHVLASPWLRLTVRANDRWQDAERDRLVRDLVLEGTALHCNVPEGVRKRLWHDPQVLSTLVAELNTTLLALEQETIDESDYRRWRSAVTHEIPMRLFEEHTVREYSDEVGTALLASHAGMRPDLVHALGWWMVSRVSREGAEAEAVWSLLQQPYQLFARYNAALGEGDPALRVDESLVKAAAVPE